MNLKCIQNIIGIVVKIARSASTEGIVKILENMLEKIKKRTEFERNARYSYDEKLAYLKQSHDSQHLQTMSYGGYDVIMLSGLGKGLRFFFYKDKQLIKMRDKVWKDDIRLYAQTYIDQVLNIRKEN